MSAAWQVVADCPACRTEGAVIELHLGDPARTIDVECQACGLAQRHVGDDHEVLQGGADMTDPATAAARLQAWAARDGATVEALCAQTMGLPVDQVLARYRDAQPVPTNLDVIAFLFPGMVAGSAVVEAHLTPAPGAPRRDRPAPTPPDPRAPVKLLVSVMLADGSLRAVEQRAIERFLERHGLEPLRPDELRPWRIHEVGPLRDPQLAEAALEAAVELMHLDGQGDASELRIVRTYARVWGVDDALVDTWNDRYDRRHRPPLAQLWRALNRWIR